MIVKDDDIKITEIQLMIVRMIQVDHVNNNSINNRDGIMFIGEKGAAGVEAPAPPNELKPYAGCHVSNISANIL